MKKTLAKSAGNKDSKGYFKGSRIPISFLFDYFEEGLSISDFVSAYPWVKKEDVINTLKEFKRKEISSKYAF
jgi:uncharacterized protein (DUF433 family)